MKKIKKENIGITLKLVLALVVLTLTVGLTSAVTWKSIYTGEKTLELDDNGILILEENITTDNYGFFGWLGSLGDRITGLFVEDINFNGSIEGTGNINTTGNMSANDFCLSDDPSSCLSDVTTGNDSVNITKDYVFLYYDTSSTQSVTVGNKIPFGTSEGSGLSYTDDSGEVTLSAGKTYRLTGHISNGGSSYRIDYQWYDTNGNPLGKRGSSASPQAATDLGDSTAEGVITPSSDTTVLLNITAASGSTYYYEPQTWAYIEQVDVSVDGIIANFNSTGDVTIGGNLTLDGEAIDSWDDISGSGGDSLWTNASSGYLEINQTGGYNQGINVTGDSVFEGNVTIGNNTFIFDGVMNKIYSLGEAMIGFVSGMVIVTGDLNVTGQVNATNFCLEDGSCLSDVTTGNNSVNLTRESYDTGWVACSDWTDQRLGDTVGGNITHGLNTPLSDLFVKIMISTDGTDDNSFEVNINHLDRQTASTWYYGYNIYQVSNNELTISTGREGITTIRDDAGGTYNVINSENWYYKVVVRSEEWEVSGVNVEGTDATLTRNVTYVYPVDNYTTTSGTWSDVTGWSLTIPSTGQYRIVVEGQAEIDGNDGGGISAKMGGLQLVSGGSSLTGTVKWLSNYDSDAGNSIGIPFHIEYIGDFSSGDIVKLQGKVRNDGNGNMWIRPTSYKTVSPGDIADQYMIAERHILEGANININTTGDLEVTGILSHAGGTYSTSAVDTGETWIDGKTIYRKAFSGTSTSGDWATLTSISGYDTIVMLHMRVNGTDGIQYSPSDNYFVPSTIGQVVTAGGDVRIYTNSGTLNSRTTKGFVEYTNL